MTLLEIARQEAAIRSAYYEERQIVGRLPPTPDQYVGRPKTDASRLARIMDEIVGRDDGIGSVDLHNIIGGSFSTVRADLRTLAAQGRIVRDGKHRGGKWRVVQVS